MTPRAHRSAPRPGPPLRKRSSPAPSTAPASAMPTKCRPCHKWAWAMPRRKKIDRCSRQCRTRKTRARTSQKRWKARRPNCSPRCESGAPTCPAGRIRANRARPKSQMAQPPNSSKTPSSPCRKSRGKSPPRYWTRGVHRTKTRPRDPNKRPPCRLAPTDWADGRARYPRWRSAALPRR